MEERTDIPAQDPPAADASKRDPWEFYRQLYLSNRFFWGLGGSIVLFALAFPFPFLFPVAKALLGLFVLIALTDAWLLFRQQPGLQVERHLPKVMSLGDENTVRIEIENPEHTAYHFWMIDELPIRFQKRDFRQEVHLEAFGKTTVQYQLRPVQRGAYQFGDIHLFMRAFFRLLERRITIPAEMEVPVYPSIPQMKKYSLIALNKLSNQQGIRQLRRLGHSYEFEQIKNYVRGDDHRSVNWMATSRHNTLMVNQYQDERAQQVYALIDKSRVMKLPFEGMSLMDYAINSSLSLLNIALQKQDKAGLLTFSDKIGATVKADRKPRQLNLLLNALYREEERPVEANYELLYHAGRKLIKGRSLLLLFTNFESSFALDRVLPILRKMNRLHLLVVVFFENTEIRDFAEQPARDLEGIYAQAFARKYLEDKQALVQRLEQYGIQTILTRPADLTVHTINKYLELKSRGLI